MARMTYRSAISMSSPSTLNMTMTLQMMAMSQEAVSVPKSFFEWIYGLIVDIWGFIAGGLLDIMGLDFAYIQCIRPQ